MRADRLYLPWVRRHGLQVGWFDEWAPALDHALADLPDSKECSREFFAALMRNPSRARKCTALVTEADRPVAVIGLRRTGIMTWDLIGGGGVAPRFLAYHADGSFFPALSTLGLNVHVGTQPEQPPAQWVRRMVPHEVFQIPLTSNFMSYWKESGHLNTVMQARKRTRDLTVEIDGAGAAEWTVRRWADHWRTGETRSQEDLVLAAAHYGKAGRMHTIRLLDGREPIAGSTFLVENDGLLLITTYVRPDYRQRKAGTRAIDATFEWATGAGFKHIDMGVGHEYKRRWAPASGTRWSCDVRPWHLHATAAVVRGSVNVGRATIKATRKALGSGGPASFALGVGGSVCMQCAS